MATKGISANKGKKTVTSPSVFFKSRKNKKELILMLGMILEARDAFVLAISRWTKTKYTTE